MISKETRIKSFAAKIKVRYVRGTAWLNFIIQFGIISTNIWIFQKWLPEWLPVFWAYWIAFALYIVLCYAIGHMDEIWGIWELENTYGTQMSPHTVSLLTHVTNIEKILEDYKKEFTKKD